MSLGFIEVIGFEDFRRCRSRTLDLLKVRSGRRGDGHGICQVNRIVSRRGSVPLGPPPRRLFLFLFGTAPSWGRSAERGLIDSISVESVRAGLGRSNTGSETAITLVTEQEFV